VRVCENRARNNDDFGDFAPYDGHVSELRPDPDSLLFKVNGQPKAQRGKLRIYFGSSAGVGKTFAMLLAARKLRGEGRDVVAGVVETHGRSETAALLEGLDIVPLKTASQRGRTFTDFDLDAALRQRRAQQIGAHIVAAVRKIRRHL